MGEFDTFSVVVKKDGWDQSSRPHTINVTMNGYQWTQTGFASLAQLRQLRDAINEYLDHEDDEA